jgi:hypothetical protein
MPSCSSEFETSHSISKFMETMPKKVPDSHSRESISKSAILTPPVISPPPPPVTSPPPPPPPPPPPIIVSPQMSDKSPKIVLSSSDGRSGLMEAIRATGGAKGAGLKKISKDESPSEVNITKGNAASSSQKHGGKQDSGGGGDDLMASLAQALEKRRKSNFVKLKIKLPNFNFSPFWRWIRCKTASN